jgi:ABC-type sugar transport system permease subunit
VEGASSAHRFRHVTLPEILPILLILAFQAFIGAAKAFSVVFVLTEGGINHSSELVSTYIFKWGFMKPEGREANLGYASALGIVYSVLLAALTLTNVIIIARRWKRRLEMEAQAGGRVVVA